MLIHGSLLKNIAVGSIRSSGRIGHCEELVINPHNLHIDGLLCRIRGERRLQLISPSDIRDFSPRGIIIDDHDRLIDPDDAIRLKPIIKIKFSMDKLQAYVGRKKVGVVEDFAVERDSLFIIKIYVKPSLFSRLSVDSLVFDRQQVDEVTRTKIVFFDTSKQKEKNFAVSTPESVVAQPSFNASLTKEYE